MQRLASVSIVSFALTLFSAAPALAQNATPNGSSASSTTWAPSNPPPPQTWTGFYIGAHIGSGFNTPQFDVAEQGPFDYNNFNSKSASLGGSLIFGGQAGYNYQFLGKLVGGGEFAFGNYGFSGEIQDGPGDDTLLETTGGAYWTGMGRVGYLVTPSSLAYFSLGFIGTTNHVRVFDDCTVSPCGPLTMDLEESGMEDQFIWGLGYEYRPGMALMKKSWSIKGEVLFSDFRSNVLVQDPDDDYSWHFSTHFPKTTVRGSFNIYF